MASKAIYIQVAEVLYDRRLAARGNGAYQVARITLAMADIFEADNPRFSREIFLAASGYREADMA